MSRIPGGNVDHLLVAARRRKVKDFLGIEFQTRDTAGTVWPERQRFLHRAEFPNAAGSMVSVLQSGHNCFLHNHPGLQKFDRFVYPKLLLLTHR